MTLRRDGGLHITGHLILSPLRNHQLPHPKHSSTPQAEWDGMGREGKGRQGCFLHGSVLTQVENVSIVPITQLNA